MRNRKFRREGYLAALVAMLLLLVCSADAATVNGTVKDRQGTAVSTNVTFKELQRPLFDFTPSVRPGWTVTVWSTNDGTGREAKPRPTPDRRGNI